MFPQLRIQAYWQLHLVTPCSIEGKTTLNARETYMKFSPEVEQTMYKLYIFCYLLMTEVAGLFPPPPKKSTK